VSRGIVYLVGAGPGDPGLLTVRALELLRSAEVVAHDSLVPEAILALANPAAERLSVGRRRGDGRRDEGLHPHVLARARAGRRVVRLKAGDPLIFGRGAEEAEALVAAGIPFEIVPGITAALGAAAYAGIPLTDRRCSSSVTFTTGHDAGPADPDVEKGTVVLYMGAHKLAEHLARLIEAGRAPATPVAYIERATQPDQRIVLGTLADVAARVAVLEGPGPALVIVGETVRLREKIAWLERRPLSGRRVLVARARPGESQIAKEVRGLGADVVEAPFVEVAAPGDAAAFVDALERVSRHGAVLFSCSIGVERTLEVAAARPGVAAALRRVPIIAIGPATIEAAKRGGLRPRAEARGACQEEWASVAPRLRMGPVLAVTSENGRPSLLADLAALGVTGVETTAAYRLVYRLEAPLPAAPDLVVLPSSSAAEAVLGSALHDVIAGVPMIAMGGRTEEAARRAGATSVIRSRRDTVPSIVAAALAFLAPSASHGIRETSVVPRPVRAEGSS